jgi:rubrerythrin
MVKKIIEKVKEYGRRKGLEDIILIRWICDSCGLIYNLTKIEDKQTNKMWCPQCHEKMHRIR